MWGITVREDLDSGQNSLQEPPKALSGDSELDKTTGAEGAVPFAAVSDPVSDEVEEFLSRDAAYKAATGAPDKGAGHKEIDAKEVGQASDPAPPPEIDPAETLVADPLPSDIEHYLLDLSQSLTILDNHSLEEMGNSKSGQEPVEDEVEERLITLKNAPPAQNQPKPQPSNAAKAQATEPAPKSEHPETLSQPASLPQVEDAEPAGKPQPVPKGQDAAIAGEPEPATKEQNAATAEQQQPKAPGETADVTLFADPLPSDIETFLLDLNQSLTDREPVEEQPDEDLLLDIPEPHEDAEKAVEQSPIDRYTKLRQVEEDIERALRGHREEVPLEPAFGGLAVGGLSLRSPRPGATIGDAGKEQSTSQRLRTADEHKESLSSTNTRLRAASAGSKGFVTGANLDPAHAVTVERAPVDSWLLGFGLLGLILVSLLAYAVIATYDADSHYKAGLSSLSHGDVDAAVLELTACLKSDPGWRSAYLYRALAYSRKGEANKAIADYNKLLEKEPDNVKAYLGRASQYLQVGEFEKVKFDCNDALRLDPSRCDAYRLKAAAEARSEQYPDAIADCQEYLQHSSGKEDPSDLADAWATLAIAHEKTKDYGAAVADYNKAIGLRPDNGLLYAGRAENYKNLRDWKSASADCSRALQLKPELNLYALRSQCYEALGQKDSALADLNTAIKRSPFNLALYRERGNVFLAKKDVPHAIADFNFVLEHNPEDREAKARLELATGKLSSTKKLVIADISDSGEKDDKPIKVAANADPEALISAGYAQLSRGDTAEAVSTLTAAVTRNPNDKTGRRYLAHALAMNGRAGEAAQQFAVLASMCTLEPADQLAFATALDRSGELEAAIPRYESYIGARPDDGHARLCLIDAYARGPSRQKAMRLASDSLNRARSPEERQQFETAIRNLQQGLPVQPLARSLTAPPGN